MSPDEAIAAILRQWPRTPAEELAAILKQMFLQLWEAEGVHVNADDVARGPGRSGGSQAQKVADC